MPPRTALLLLAVAAPAGSGSGAPAHLTYMTDFDSSYFPARAQPLQHTWLNFLLPVVADACTEKHGPVCPDALAGITHGWERYGKRSLYTELPDLHGSALAPPPTPPHDPTTPMHSPGAAARPPDGQGVFDRAHQGLDPNWDSNLAAIATALRPFLANRTCAGVFVGVC